MASQLLRSRSLALFLPALTLAISACGGGSTGGAVGGTTAASAPPPTTAVQPAPTTTAPQPAAAAPTPSATAPTTQHAPPPTSARRAQRSAGDAAAEDPQGGAPDDPAAAAAPRSPPATTPAPAATPPAPEPTGTPIDERAELTLTDRESPAHYFQQGTVTGTYEGTMAAEVRITSKGVFVDFTATVEGGTIVGRALAVAVIDGRPMPLLRGTAAIYGGTGRFADVRGRRLKVSGRSKPDGSQARVRLVGVLED